MSEAEFDNIPDDFANIDDTDWDTLLSAPVASSLPPSGATVRSPVSTPSHYFSGDEELGDDVLEQLDVLEANYQATSSRLGPPPTSRPEGSTGNSVFEPRSSLPDAAVHLPYAPLPSKRYRSRSTSPKPAKKGKMKSEGRDEVQQMFLDYEDELTCPICHDLFVAAQVGNPCGHSVCGDCGWGWVAKNKNGGCAVCRTSLSRNTPFIPNISVDNLVDKYIQTLRSSGDEEWNTQGRKYKELHARKQHWKDGANERAHKKTRHRKRKKSSVELEVIVI